MSEYWPVTWRACPSHSLLAGTCKLARSGRRTQIDSFTSVHKKRIIRTIYHPIELPPLRKQFDTGLTNTDQCTDQLGKTKEDTSPALLFVSLTTLLSEVALDSLTHLIYQLILTYLPAGRPEG